ncbi:MAG TPA: type II toxin-antitoxin system VapC family toxin, partial [Nitrospirota bacterium]|nr:type II toxin-antitoxin system VapC family toxin [Nitrospirota bacterium]
MKFWDASAIIPLCIEEPQTRAVQEIAKKDGSLVVWWGSIVECYSAFSRLKRDGVITLNEDAQIRALLTSLADAWTEIEPSDDIRDITQRLLQNYPLRAADALQLAAAIVWTGKTPRGHHVVCLDAKLRDAASSEGFMV